MMMPASQNRVVSALQAALSHYTAAQAAAREEAARIRAGTEKSGRQAPHGTTATTSGAPRKPATGR